MGFKPVRIQRTGSNPMSVMKKHMNYISGMFVKARVASITEGQHIIHGIPKKKCISLVVAEHVIMRYSQTCLKRLLKRR